MADFALDSVAGHLINLASHDVDGLQDAYLSASKGMYILQELDGAFAVSKLEHWRRAVFFLTWAKSRLQEALTRIDHQCYVLRAKNGESLLNRLDVKGLRPTETNIVSEACVDAEYEILADKAARIRAGRDLVAPLADLVMGYKEILIQESVHTRRIFDENDRDLRRPI